MGTWLNYISYPKEHTFRVRHGDMGTWGLGDMGAWGLGDILGGSSQLVSG